MGFWLKRSLHFEQEIACLQNPNIFKDFFPMGDRMTGLIFSIELAIKWNEAISYRIPNQLKGPPVTVFKLFKGNFCASLPK
jgi:hypothetical protein